jgi:hypothetical protein
MPRDLRLAIEFSASPLEAFSHGVQAHVPRAALRCARPRQASADALQEAVRRAGAPAWIRAWSEASIPSAACSRLGVCSRNGVRSEFAAQRPASILFLFLSLLPSSACSRREEQSRHALWVRGGLRERRSLIQSWFQSWAYSRCVERSQRALSLRASIREREFLLRSWSRYLLCSRSELRLPNAFWRQSSWRRILARERSTLLRLQICFLCGANSRCEIGLQM